MNNESEPSDYYPRRSKWHRAILMIVILFCYSFAEAVIWFLSFVQFFWTLFKAEPNSHIQNFADGLIKWTSNAISFCLWKTDMPPFPFAAWPDSS